MKNVKFVACVWEFYIHFHAPKHDAAQNETWLVPLRSARLQQGYYHILGPERKSRYKVNWWNISCDISGSILNFMKLQKHFLCTKIKITTLLLLVFSMLCKITADPLMSHGLFYHVLFLGLDHGSCIAGQSESSLKLCYEDEWRSYRFGTTWGWVINDRIYIFEWKSL